jgi:MYXO-CTERM domain-containing protein
VLLLGLALADRAWAQTFPAASAYVPLSCGANPMVDALGDTPNAAGPLDLVGTNAFPAGFHAADAQFLYLRMRLAATPLTGNMLQANAWGFEFDLDGDRTTYELLITASGLSNPSQVAIYRHPTTVTIDDPADPAEVPPASADPFASHGRVTVADSTLSGAPDAFLELAVSWTELAAAGVQRDTPVYVWAGSSTVANALDLDLACFSGAGGHLSGIDVGRTTPDPSAGGGGGGTGGGGGGGTGPRTLEGGLGCSVAAHAAAPSSSAALALVVVLLAARRRRRAA